jgi:hypothetical protein
LTNNQTIMNAFISKIAALFFRVQTPKANKEPATVKLERKVDKPEAYRRMLLTVAREELAKGIRETSRNQHPELEKYWRRTSYGIAGFKNREPWCAAFSAYTTHEAAWRIWPDENEIPFSPCRSAGVVNWVAWAKTAKGWECLPAARSVRAGDWICWDFNGAKASGTHIGLATSDERPDGTFNTIEGNTNGEGSRDGDGLYAKTTRTRKSAIAIIRYKG